MKKTIAILGATGSVGQQACDVARQRGYAVDLISADKNDKEAEKIAREFSPRAVVMNNTEAAKSLKIRLRDTGVRVYSGDELSEAVAKSEAKTVVNSVLGEAGLFSSLATIEAGKRLALANKESLVVAGDIVMKRAREKGVRIIPVDSEHSAIFQSLKSGRKAEIKTLILTASGGPFFGRSREELRSVTLEETLSHPTWKMGKKITVDSATLMNKGFEVIEAAHLFGVCADKIKVVVHRESILHSAVEYIDNSVIGELSVPDMRACVQYAVDYPRRSSATIGELDLISLGRLTFAEVDREAFPLLSLAGSSMLAGGAMPAVLNAADEVIVSAFLCGKIPFYRISELVAMVYGKMSDASRAVTLEEIIEADRMARAIAEETVRRI